MDTEDQGFVQFLRKKVTKYPGDSFDQLLIINIKIINFFNELS